jgi:hypothetical protein
LERQFFENQKEFRIIIADQEIEEPLTVNIGNISDISKEFKASDFFSDRFAIQLPK